MIVDSMHAAAAKQRVGGTSMIAIAKVAQRVALRLSPLDPGNLAWNRVLACSLFFSPNMKKATFSIQPKISACKVMQVYIIIYIYNNYIYIIIYIYTCQFPIFNHIKSQFWSFWGYHGVMGYPVSSIFSHPGTLHRATEALAALRIAVPFGQPFVTSLGGWGNASWVWNRGCPNNPQFI
jgi:hypothetical protein